MGVPKFFRYMSERYPCLSELVREYQVPEFDNLYLDMNGIIHNCSHPDDGNTHFRITEEKIFSDIFHYIEVLFQMIKPQKVFFMAVDGVAPRAKMNQQRGRRFRSAKDSQKLEDDAVKKGEEIPKEPRFDSNCITPGTEFMARLHEQLKYFVVKKVSQDPLWQRCQIILSGHETPGEGEHKIMDFIRYKRSQSGYDPNTRHCLYGLDADLIMLGLCTHDPHFSLLREEVKFGKKATKHTGVPEEVKFFLLHLSLMREYLEMEFSILKETLKKFKFDIEKIIDDWVLMGFLVGNDFIPNLPNLHITNGALPVVYKVYMDVLPELDGYINENGILNLERFEVFMKKLGEIDVQNFEEVRDDLLYMEAKTGRKMQPFVKNKTKLRDLEHWKPEKEQINMETEILKSLEPHKAPRDSGLNALIAATEHEYLNDDNESSDDYDDNEEFENYKRSYYMNKLEYHKVTQKVMKSQAEGYVRAIQWNLHYYYNGVCSWSWYYPHHYAPYISDIKSFQNLKLEYDYGKPFMPYEQLLAVLPSASRGLLPECYQTLMTDENSPIKKYYPENFDTDLNGKRQEWEAVVLVPFIDENKLLETMKACNNQLSPSEVERNRHGPMLSYTYTGEDLGVYESPMYFSNISVNHAKVAPITIDEIRVPIEKLVKGSYPGVLMDVYYPGFPTLKNLKYQGRLRKAKVKVFEQPSRGDNMIIQVIPSERVLDGNIPLELLGKSVYVGWPHLVEARVVKILSSKEQYVHVGEGLEPVLESAPTSFRLEINSVTEYYSNRLGIEFGKVLVLVKVQTMIGQKYMITSKGSISLEKVFCENTSNYPLQVIVENINVYSETRDVPMTLDDLFPVGSTCYMLTPNEYYGSKGIIQDYDKASDGKVCVSIICYDEPNLSKAIHMAKRESQRYRAMHVASGKCGMPKNLFSRITGSFFATARGREGGVKTVNLGLDLKLTRKNLETPGYTKRIEGIWYYSDSTIEIVNAYADQFPEIFDFVAKYSNNKDDTAIEDIFPVDSDEKVRAVQAWLKSQPHSQVERRICESEFLEKEIVEEIEKVVDNLSVSNSKNITISCKPDLLYKSEIIFGNILPDQSVQVHLFDRIVNVRSNHTVPFGLRGTVIGIHAGSLDSMYDILFDYKFEGGTEINCTEGRGFRLPANAFINISHGIRNYKVRRGKSEEVAIFPTQMHRDDYTQKKYQSYNHQNNRNVDNGVAQNSAFAKFNNNPLGDVKPSYNAVPPFMPDGEPIYKPHNPYINRQSNSKQQQSQQIQIRYNSRSDQSFDCRNPFPKQYASNSYQNPSTHHVHKNNNNNQRGMTSGEGRIHDRQRDIRGKSGNSIQKKTDFMPSFNRIQQRNPIEETADALKKLLKIDAPIANEDKSIPPSKTYNQRPMQSNKTHQQQKNKVKPDVVSGTPFSVQLLTYYQSKGLGLPRYQYDTIGDSVQSQIKLPNRQIILGPPAKSREEASEFVAEKALRILNSKEEQMNTSTDQTKQSPKKFPTPPKQWWNPDQKDELQDHHGRKMPRYPSNEDASKNSWKGLIPLQVVKKEKANSSNSTAVLAEIGGSNESKKNSRTVLTEKTDNSSKEVTQGIQLKGRRPRRQREMRIAANFAVKP